MHALDNREPSVQLTEAPSMTFRGRMKPALVAAQRAANRLPLGESLLTLVAIYTVHYFFCALFVVGRAPQLLRPFWSLPLYLYYGWDSTYYKHLYQNFDLYVWPPLYPLALRLVTFVLGFTGNPFEKSAVILNLVSHFVIIAGLSAYMRNDERLKGVAPWLVAFFLFFEPGHNVFFAAYAESFFLALTIVAFLFRKHEQIGVASVVAGLSSIARLMGAFLVFALISEQLFYFVRDRKFRWRKLLAASSGLLFVAGWQASLVMLGTSSTQAGAEWVRELVATHVPHGDNPTLWVLKYLSFSWHIEIIAFWISIVATIYCGFKKRYAEMFYMIAFNLSLLLYLYRPFGWTRYVSVFFPIYIMFADWLKAKPRLACALLMSCAAASCYMQAELFMGHIGEP